MNGKTIAMVCLNDVQNMVQSAYDTVFLSVTQLGHFESVEQFKYLGTTLTDQNYSQEEIKSRLKSENVCYNSVQNLQSSSLLYKDLKIKIHGTIILPVVLYGSATWSLTLREERRLRAFENRVLRIYGPTWDDITGE